MDVLLCPGSLSPGLLNLLQNDDSIVDDLLRFSELVVELQVGDRVRHVENRCRSRHLGILISGRHFQLGVGDSKVLDSLTPGKDSAVHEITPLEHTWVAGEVHGEHVGLGDVPNVDNVWRDLGDGALHDAVDVLICAKHFFGNGAGVGFWVRAEDEAGVNYEIFLFQNSSKRLG